MHAMRRAHTQNHYRLAGPRGRQRRNDDDDGNG